MWYLALQFSTRIVAVSAPRRTQAASLLSGTEEEERGTGAHHKYFFHHLWCTMCANRFPDVPHAFL